MQLKKKKKTFYSIMVGLLQKRGKKVKAQKILNKSFKRYKEKIKLTYTTGFKNVVSHLGNIIELRQIRVGRNFKVVPYPIKRARQKFNIMRTFYTAARKDKNQRDSMPKRISLHLISISAKLDYRTKHLKKNLNQEIVKNRANIHFRWE